MNIILYIRIRGNSEDEIIIPTIDPNLLRKWLKPDKKSRNNNYIAPDEEVIVQHATNISRPFYIAPIYQQQEYQEDPQKHL